MMAAGRVPLNAADGDNINMTSDEDTSSKDTNTEEAQDSQIELAPGTISIITFTAILSLVK